MLVATWLRTRDNYSVWSKCKILYPSYRKDAFLQLYNQMSLDLYSSYMYWWSWYFCWYNDSAGIPNIRFDRKYWNSNFVWFKWWRWQRWNRWQQQGFLSYCTLRFVKILYSCHSLYQPMNLFEKIQIPNIWSLSNSNLPNIPLLAWSCFNELSLDSSYTKTVLTMMHRLWNILLLPKNIFFPLTNGSCPNLQLLLYPEENKWYTLEMKYLKFQAIILQTVNNWNILFYLIIFFKLPRHIWICLSQLYHKTILVLLKGRCSHQYTILLNTPKCNGIFK